ncbi:DUF982 domain-containing protein [Roseobacteraceae bacterium NS-SX3]
MIEIFWGSPISIFLPSEGRIRKVTTIEQARIWLQKAWPVSDHHRDAALEKIDAAMDCLAPVGAARDAFLLAARAAGFQADRPAAAYAAAPQLQSAAFQRSHQATLRPGKATGLN